MIRKLLIIALVFISSVTLAQNVTIEAYAPNVVELGEQFRLTYTLRVRPTSFNPPAIADFDVIAGPSTSSSTSIEVINGKVIQNQSITYTYILEATKEGKFNIEGAEAIINGEKVKSNSLSIEVVKVSSNTRQNNQTTKQQTNGADLPNDELFVTVETNKKTAYLGEPILATLKIYTRVQIVGFEDYNYPTFDNFWSQVVDIKQDIYFDRVNLNGKIYSVGTIRKYLLFPQKSGKIEINPFETVVIYQGRSTRPQSIFDEFFGGVESYRKRLVSKSISLNIRQLPDNAPESFVGAVGAYKIDASTDKTKLKTNDAITVKLKISGSGNLKLIGTPKVEFPAGFELFDPKVSDNINTTANNTSGTKTIEYIAIPRSAGTFEIPPVEFTYFDLNKESYVTLRSKAMPIEVLADSTVASGVMITGYSKEDVKFIGKDIRFIKTSHSKLLPINSFVVTSGIYFFIYIILIIAFLSFWYLYSKHREQMTDLSIVRTRKASKTAQKRLKEASIMLNQDNAEKFYEEIHRALWGYTADKLSIPIANLNSDRVKEELVKRNVDNIDIEEFIRIIDACEFARFAPNREHSQMDALYEATYTLISKFEQTLGKAKSNLW
ncbi:MAG: protein BatD [Bacteroidales bacterium]|nr:MAG: protein BatD [Bacteroidales bacterium]